MRGCGVGVSACLLMTACLFALSAGAQSGSQDVIEMPGPPPPQMQEQQPQSQNQNATRTAVHGTVLNSATGEPVARALVSVEGDPDHTMLTDGEGHFEFDGITTGQHVMSAKKPGYRGGDNLDGDVITDVPGGEGASHGVVVTEQTPDIIFKLTPNGAIRGHVDLSTGDPADGILMQLTERRVINGRAEWTVANTARTNSSGNYRFSGLAAGTYLVRTMPSMEAESLGIVSKAVDAPKLVKYGFASVYYPEAREITSAGRIELRAGEEAQANLFLRLEAYQPVQAWVQKQQGEAEPGGAARSAKVELVSVTDERGNPTDYRINYNTERRIISGELPDGIFSLNMLTFENSNLSLDTANGMKMGSVSFAVAGHPVTDLKLTTGPVPMIRVHVNLPESVARQTSTSGRSMLPVFVTFTHADGPTQELAATGGAVQDTFSFLPGGTGRYWANATTERAGLCVGSFTAGGADMGREPLALSPTSSTPQMELTLRDDCAKLNLSLPLLASIETAGAQTNYTVYVVPDAETTATVTPSTLRAGSGATATFESLTPGSYHIYVFTEPVELEYHNPSALAHLSGQAVTLAPSSSNDVVLEVPQP